MSTIDSHTHSLLLIVTDSSGRLETVVACDGIDPLLERITSMVTHVEEDWYAAHDVVLEAWVDFVHSDRPRKEFVFSRPRVSTLRFTMIATADVEVGSRGGLDEWSGVRP